MGRTVDSGYTVVSERDSSSNVVTASSSLATSTGDAVGLITGAAVLSCGRVSSSSGRTGRGPSTGRVALELSADGRVSLVRSDGRLTLGPSADGRLGLGLIWISGRDGRWRDSGCRLASSSCGRGKRGRVKVLEGLVLGEVGGRVLILTGPLVVCSA